MARAPVAEYAYYFLARRGLNSKRRMHSNMKGGGMEAAHMLVVHVYVHVLLESVEQFKEATSENARHSLQEPGVARFDVVQQRDDPTRFVLVEVYRTEEAALAHKDTAHYQAWRDAVAPMMAEPRSSMKYTNVFPGPEGW